jgi:hypothetical protein
VKEAEGELKLKVAEREETIAGQSRKTGIRAMTQTLLNLRAAPVTRWTPKRKAAVVSAIRHHALTDATEYGVDQTEIELWSVLFVQEGGLALRAINTRFVAACCVTICIKPA